MLSAVLTTTMIVLTCRRLMKTTTPPPQATQAAMPLCGEEMDQADDGNPSNDLFLFPSSPLSLFLPFFVVPSTGTVFQEMHE
jgi:hypothetical protein